MTKSTINNNAKGLIRTVLQILDFNEHIFISSVSTSLYALQTFQKFKRIKSIHSSILLHKNTLHFNTSQKASLNYRMQAVHLTHTPLLKIVNFFKTNSKLLKILFIGTLYSIFPIFKSIFLFLG